MRIISLLLCLSTFSVHAQFNGAESVEYDPIGDRYFVSNTQTGVISILEQGGTVSTFASGLAAGPHGLELLADTLYACSGGTVLGFLRSTGAQVATFALGGSFLNGLTTDGTFLYATDFSAQRIYKIDPSAGTWNALVSVTSYTPNGIVYDPVADRLVVVSWGGNAGIHQVDPVTGATQLLTNTGLTNLDGITIDCVGNFWVTSWSPDQLTMFEPSFAQAGVAATGIVLNNAADIDFDDVNDVVAVPNTGTNNVVFYAPSSCSTGLTEADRNDIGVFPIPASDELFIRSSAAHGERFQLDDLGGRTVLRGRIAANGRVDLVGVPNGVYVLRVPVLAGATRVVVQR